MNLFGSREEDPLLQDDPFAPDSDDPSSASEPRSADPDTDPNPAVPTEGEQQEEDGRTLVYTQEEAETGPLSELNQAFDQEWRLKQIQFRDDGALVFTLRHQAGAGGGLGNII